MIRLAPRTTAALTTALALAGAAASVGASPAAAAPGDRVDVYDVTFAGHLDLHRVGHDTSIAGIDWRRETSLVADVVSVAKGVEIDAEAAAAPATRPTVPQRVSGTDVEDTIAMTVDGGLQTSSCVNDGEGKAHEGEVSFARAAGGALAVTFRPFNAFQVPASCSGFSGAKGIFDFSSEPPEAKTTLLPGDVGRDTIVRDLQGLAPCPQTAATEPTVMCSALWTGRLTFQRVRTIRTEREVEQGPGQEQAPGQQPAPAPGPGGSGGRGPIAEPGPIRPTGDGPTGDPKVDAVIASIDRLLKGAKVTADCPTGCTGKISAYAVARERARRGLTKPLKVGSGKLVAPKGGTSAKGTVTFSPSARRAIRRTGAVELRTQITPTAGAPRTERVVLLVPRSR